MTIFKRVIKWKNSCGFILLSWVHVQVLRILQKFNTRHYSNFLSSAVFFIALISLVSGSVVNTIFYFLLLTSAPLPTLPHVFCIGQLVSLDRLNGKQMSTFFISKCSTGSTNGYKAFWVLTVFKPEYVTSQQEEVTEFGLSIAI